MTTAASYAQLIYRYQQRINRVQEKYKGATLGSPENSKRFQELSRLEDAMRQVSRDAYSFLSRDAHREMLNILMDKIKSKV